MIRYLTLLFFAAMLFMNYLANSLPINGKTTGQVSAAYSNLFVPAGITFSIWGIIYLLLAVYCVVQFMPAYKETAIKIGWLFSLSCLFNGLWLIAWHYQRLPLSLLIMIGLLVTLIMINLQLRDLPPGLLKAAWGIYLGWICIATIANVTALLVGAGWGGIGISQEVWAIIMIAIGTLIVSITILRINNPYIGLSVIWAFAGIIIRRSDDYRSIVIAAVIGILVVGVVTLMGFLGKRVG
ncbi:MAG: tryptophan-rich sensory protein [Bacteroidales bacterium]|nr:tryptophan-rich sensory protein [Bacteroidales bacterium]MBN2697465.1 tryptophan-rich sensory protein [Bacteroidales bacterium]